MLVAIGSVLYVYTSGGDGSTPIKKMPPKSKVGGTGTTDYNPLDYSLQTADLKVAPKDAFLPLVARGNGSNAEGGPIGIPPYLTGGEDWNYTGMVQVNGKPEAVLESPKTSDTVFLTIGQRWKKAKVKRISDSAVELADDQGKTFVVKMSEAPVKNDTLPPVDQNAQAQQSPLTGPINPQQLNVTPLPAVGNGYGGGGYGGGGGGRRRRGGGGGGGGYGGGGGGAAPGG